MRFSRTRLSSRWFPHRDGYAKHMNCNNGEQPLCRDEGLSYWPPVTPFPSASHTCSLHFEASTHDRFGPFVSAPCLTLAGTDGALPCSRRGAHASTFLSPFPQNGFASRSFSELPRSGTMKTLTPTPLTYGAGLPVYLATPSCRSVSNHVGCLSIAITTPACPASFGLRHE